MYASVNMLFSRKLREWEVQGNEIFWVMEDLLIKLNFVLLLPFLTASFVFFFNV